MPYRKILLCVDNSPHSNLAVEQAGVIATAFKSTVVAAHVYAARLHDRRFVDLEPGLPSEYRDPKRLEASRHTHDSLIGEGLRMISDSYLQAARARLDGLTVESKNIEGKNYLQLVAESRRGYDLTVLGARGLGLSSMIGRCSEEALGSVCERVLRSSRVDTLVVRDSRPPGGKIVVGVDGSPESYGALRKALRLAATGGEQLEAVSCFDPHFHPVAFKSIAGVLSPEQAGAFRFDEQEQLHDHIINHGLENLYTSYLDNARTVARGRGQEIETRLLTGKPAYAIAERARQLDSNLVVVGRFGLHRTDDLDIGSTAETVVRNSPGNVLVVNDETGGLDLRWTIEAKARLTKVPEFMRPMVGRAIESYAKAHNLRKVTAEVVNDAKLSHGVPVPGHSREPGS